MLRVKKKEKKNTDQKPKNGRPAKKRNQKGKKEH